MKPQELKIGNLLCYNGEVVKVEQITKHKIGYHTKPNETRMNYARLCEIEPIPITEELLLKCGLLKSYYSEKIFTVEGESCEGIYYVEGKVFDIRGGSGRASITCKYLHQLQNAYYLAIGKELEIKI